jgi:peptide/nickel transport system substrate-binding protein
MKMGASPWCFVWLALLGIGCRCTEEDRARDQAGAPLVATEQSGATRAGPSEAWLRGDLAAQRAHEARLTPRMGGEVVLQLPESPPSLNTIVDEDWWVSRIVDHNVYESLLSVSWYDHPRYQHVPELAERWEVSQDGRLVTFHLRKGVTWHDGKPFGSRDVKATFDKVLDPKTKAAHLRATLEELERYEVIDEATIRFFLKNPHFVALDAFASIPIHPAHVIEGLTGSEYNKARTNPLNRAPIGTGPFRFERWEPNVKIVFKRHPDYWGEKAHLDRLVFRQVMEAEVGLQLAERGELDVVTRIEPGQWARMAERERLVSHYDRSRFNAYSYAWIGWNQNNPRFQDKRVRRALTLLTDRAGIIKSLMYDLFTPTDCHFYVESKELCDPKTPKLAYDPMAASKLLEEAGWKDRNSDGVLDKDGMRFELTLMLPVEDDEAQRLGAKLKEDFARVGIGMALQSVEWGAFSERLRERKFDACMLVWGFSLPREDPTKIWHSKSIDGGSNYVGFRHARADAIMETARRELDPAKRNALYRELMEILRDEQPYTWLYTYPNLTLYAKRLRGVRESLLGFRYRDFWVAADPGLGQ